MLVFIISNPPAGALMAAFSARWGQLLLDVKRSKWVRHPSVPIIGSGPP